MKNKVLHALKTTDGFVSGASLSALLGVSRSAVWKAVGALKQEGYAIESVTNRGYRLISSPDLLTGPELTPLLTTRFVGREVYSTVSVDSTNLFARREAEQGAADGAVFFAEEQTAGRGRLGRTWTSNPGEGIILSVLLRPQVRPQDIAQITLVAGLAVCDALRSQTDLNPTIKWPNDLLLNNKKIVGILSEMSAEAERISWLVVGIGVNVNNLDIPEPLRMSATSLALESGRKYERIQLAAAICNAFEQQYLAFLEHGITPDFVEAYSRSCVTIGREVRVLPLAPGEAVTGTATGITPQGALIVRTAQGEQLFNACEVSVRGLPGYADDFR